jgi:Ricin-type beta-trefoil lectin domain-like
MIRAILTATACALFASSALAEDKYVKLVHVDTGKVLAVVDNSDEAGARTVLAKDGKEEALQWKVVKDGDALKIVNRKSGKVLDVYEASTDEGTQIIIWDEKTEDFDNQRWSWVGEGKERRLKGKSSGLVLDIDADGKVIQKKADDKSKKQLWRVEEVK